MPPLPPARRSTVFGYDKKPDPRAINPRQRYAYDNAPLSIILVGASSVTRGASEEDRCMPTRSASSLLVRRARSLSAQTSHRACMTVASRGALQGRRPALPPLQSRPCGGRRPVPYLVRCCSHYIKVISLLLITTFHLCAHSLSFVRRFHRLSFLFGCFW